MHRMKPNFFSEFPERIRASSERPDLSYVQLPKHYAIHGPLPAHLAPSVLLHLNDQSIAVCRGTPDQRLMQDISLAITPVYSLEPSGPPAVPSGLVFLRFKENIKAKEQHQTLTSAGYTITDIPLYALHTAWVRYKSGDIAAALTNLPSLETLSDVVNVEPQMLTKRALRSIPSA